MNDKNASQEEVDEARDNLQAAINGLEEAVDKTLLEAMVNKVSGLEEGKYVTSTWEAMVPVLQEAKDVLANEKASQKEVDASLEALTKAYLELRLIPDKDLLSELINKAKGLNGANYSAKTWSEMTGALEEATAVLNDPEASQEEVDNAKDVLAKAIAGLEANPVVTPVKAGDTTAGVKTGDEVNVIYSLAGLAIASIILYENKKRKSLR